MKNYILGFKPPLGGAPPGRGGGQPPSGGRPSANWLMAGGYVPRGFYPSFCEMIFCIFGSLSFSLVFL